MSAPYHLPRHVQSAHQSLGAKTQVFTAMRAPASHVPSQMLHGKPCSDSLCLFASAYFHRIKTRHSRPIKPSVVTTKAHSSIGS